MHNCMNYFEFNSIFRFEKNETPSKLQKSTIKTCKRTEKYVSV